MKQTMQIAMECDLTYNEVKHVINAEKIKPASISSGKHYFDKYQEELIHHVLYFKGKLKEITYESKINFCDEQTDIRTQEIGV